MHSPNGFFFYSFHSSLSSSYPSSSFSPTKFLPQSIHIVSATPRSKLFIHQNNLQPCRTTTARSIWIALPQIQLQLHSTALPLDTATPANIRRVSSLSSHPLTLIMSVSACGPWYQKKSPYPSLTGIHASRASIVLSAARVSLLHFLITANCSPLELSVCLSVSDMTPRRKSGPASGRRLCMGGLRMTGHTRRSISTMAESSLWYICWRIGRILLFGSASLMSLRTSFSSPASGSRYVSFTVVQQEILKPRDPLFNPCWRMLACFFYLMSFVGSEDGRVHVRGHARHKGYRMVRLCKTVRRPRSVRKASFFTAEKDDLRERSSVYDVLQLSRERHHRLDSLHWPSCASIHRPPNL